MGRSATQPAKYVYGVVHAAPKADPKVRGIDGKPLRVVASKGLGAITSDVPDEPIEAGRDELLAHSRVLEAALDDGAVLPMRFGVVMPSESSVRTDLLDAHRPDLEAQLEEMAGKVEVNVRGMYAEGEVLREIVAENPEIAALRQSIAGADPDASYFERIRLGELVAEALDQKRDADERRILGRLVPLAIAVEPGQAIHERMAVNAAFLLDRNGLKAFDDALEGLAAENHPRIGFKMTGPLPPHSFVELSVEG